LNYYEYFYAHVIQTELNYGNGSVSLTLQELYRTGTRWLHAIEFLPAGEQGHTLDWCLETDNRGYTELMNFLFKRLRLNGFKVRLQGGRQMVFQNSIVISWDSQPKWEFDFIFD
tara:strand:- start:134 stop:475 length:342 start_codon:yes stop_codon:yes gene_type:complete